jgi:predicted small secreted protein
MKRAAVLVLLAVSLASCRTARPTGAPLAPLTAASIEEAAMQLREQRATFTNVRSLMRVRATTNGKTQSFRAQLAVHDAQRMELVAYTPVGTTALTLKANGNQEVAPESFAFLRAAGLTPAETAMLLLGMPPRDDVPVTLAPTGIASASAGELTVTFDPPSFPAKRVIITRGADRVEIEHLEVVR